MSQPLPGETENPVSNDVFLEFFFCVFFFDATNHPRTGYGEVLGGGGDWKKEAHWWDLILLLIHQKVIGIEVSCMAKGNFAAILPADSVGW